MLRNKRPSPRQQSSLLSRQTTSAASSSGQGGKGSQRACFGKIMLWISIILSSSVLWIMFQGIPTSLDLSSLDLLDASASALTSEKETLLTGTTPPAAAGATAQSPPTTPALDAKGAPKDALVKTGEPLDTAAAAAAADTNTAAAVSAANDPDADCPFRDSPLYRKIFVYPTYGHVKQGWNGSILSEAGRNLTALAPWPWLQWERESRFNQSSHYDINGQHVQYATELLVRDIITHPESCLRTDNPEEATLFYVPYFPSVEHHQGSKRINDMSPSPWGKAIMDVLEGDYQGWEDHFGLTSEYWKRRKGADHILVFSEPMHGLWHPRSRRGNFHFVKSQKQLEAPIVISVELSTTFVQMYPNCAAKNILVPYPNTDGRWFNGQFESEAVDLLRKANLTVSNSEAALPAEQTLDESADSSARPVAQFYAAGNHGTCKWLRQSMQKDYNNCAPSAKTIKSQLKKSLHAHAMRLATFCPCPGGDSPSAKRMFDALLAGCIPIILSSDFVWPFTKEFDPQTMTLDPLDFSVRLNATDYTGNKLDEQTCQTLNATEPGLQAWMDAVPVEELQRLRRGVAKARELYGYYKHDDATLPDNPLREGVLPNGGAAHAIVNALADRAAGARWSACAEELKQPREEDPRQFKC